MRKRKGEKGYALIAAMAAGVIALSITSAVILRMSSSTSQIIKRENEDKAMVLTESVANTVLDSFAEMSANTTLDLDGSNSVDSNDWGIYITAKELSERLHSATGYGPMMDVGENTDSTKTIIFASPSPSASPDHAFPSSGTAATFFNNVETSTTHSGTFWSHFNNDSTSTALNAGRTFDGQNTTTLLNDLHNSAYSTYHVTRNGVEADVRISVVPLATSISGTSDATLHTPGTFHEHMDLFRMRVESFIPSMANSRETRQVEVIFQRPVKKDDIVTFTLSNAVLAGGDLNTGNYDTSAGFTSGVIDTAQTGDVHTNGNLTIGSNGSVQGKATATGTVTVNDNANPTVVLPDDPCPGSPRVCASPDPRVGINSSKLGNKEESQSHYDPLPIPEINTGDLPTATCSPYPLPTGSGPFMIQYHNCVVPGDLTVNNGKYYIEFGGAVHIQGDLTNNGGSFKCADIGGPCRIVVDDDIDQGGNSDSNYGNEIEAAYISVNGDMSIRGTSGTSGTDHGNLFYAVSPTSSTTFSGNSEFFGAIVTNGTFQGNGNATSYGIQRDADMSALKDVFEPEPPPKDDLFPNVVSWKTN